MDYVSGINAHCVSSKAPIWRHFSQDFKNDSGTILMDILEETFKSPMNLATNIAYHEAVLGLCPSYRVDVLSISARVESELSLGEVYLDANILGAPEGIVRPTITRFALEKPETGKAWLVTSMKIMSSVMP